MSSGIARDLQTQIARRVIYPRTASETRKSAGAVLFPRLQMQPQPLTGLFVMIQICKSG